MMRDMGYNLKYSLSLFWHFCQVKKMTRSNSANKDKDREAQIKIERIKANRDIEVARQLAQNRTGYIWLSFFDEI